MISRIRPHCIAYYQRNFNFKNSACGR